MKVIWAYIFILSCVLASAASPQLALLGLIMVSASLGVYCGMVFLSWFFFSIILMYVGGMMVMFMYTMSLFSSFKVDLVVPSVGVLVSGGSGLVVVSGITGPPVGGHPAWLGAAYTPGGAGAIVFMIVYLLAVLVVVFQVCQKLEGPMKSGTSWKEA